ncbi:hypothetical protein K445DRAFT_15318 [Daldinia sp. EC12]|nr:hypothetical protein K445DRAFT_15318 [Daldinia sp. EC12]
MCSTVLFTYRCGCTHITTFECPDTASTFSSLVPGPSRSGLNHPHLRTCSRSRSRRCRRRQRCYGPGTAPTTTPLDEDCFDCAQKREETRRRAASLSDVDISSLSLSRDTDAESESDLDTAVVSMSSVLSTRASSPLDETILKERDPNIPSRCPLVSILDLDLDLRMQLMDMDLLEESHGGL